MSHWTERPNCTNNCP